MTIPEIMIKMIAFSKGNTHDINHFIKVHTYAKTIGESEGLDPDTLFILEAAAIVHDIACPLCREKYGNTNGKMQEKEGIPLTHEFFGGSDLTAKQIERIAYLVGHHHTLTDITDTDYQILIEADYLVNSDEMSFPKDKIKSFRDKYFKTETGKKILNTIYSL